MERITLEFSEVKIDKFSTCRLCMKRGEYYLSIFVSTEASSVSIGKTIEDLLNLEVTEDDGLPGAACHPCVAKLTELREFKEMCVKSATELGRKRVLDGATVTEGDMPETARESLTENEKCRQDNSEVEDFPISNAEVDPLYTGNTGNEGLETARESLTEDDGSREENSEVEDFSIANAEVDPLYTGNMVMVEQETAGESLAENDGSRQENSEVEDFSIASAEVDPLYTGNMMVVKGSDSSVIKVEMSTEEEIIICDNHEEVDPSAETIRIIQPTEKMQDGLEREYLSDRHGEMLDNPSLPWRQILQCDDEMKPTFLTVDRILSPRDNLILSSENPERTLEEKLDSNKKERVGTCYYSENASQPDDRSCGNGESLMNQEQSENSTEYVCDRCGIRFVDKNTLSEHIRGHVTHYVPSSSEHLAEMSSMEQLKGSFDRKTFLPWANMPNHLSAERVRGNFCQNMSFFHENVTNSYYVERMSGNCGQNISLSQGNVSNIAPEEDIRKEFAQNTSLSHENVPNVLRVECFQGNYDSSTQPNAQNGISAETSAYSSVRFDESSWTRSCEFGEEPKERQKKRRRIKVGCANMFKCKVCSKEFKYKSVLTQHLFAHSSEKQFSCKECGREFKFKAGLLQHAATHGAEPHRCRVCDKKYLRRKSLERHMSVHTGENRFPCRTCGKSFVSIANLRQHLGVHTTHRPFQCGHCGKRFRLKHNLACHVTRHDGLRPYKCGTCEKSFKTKDNLCLHLKIHSGLREFPCKLCGKSFYRKDHLANHKIRVHENIKPFGCGFCGRRFAEGDSLAKHVAKHNEERRFQCDLCGKAYKIKGYLVSHMHNHYGTNRLECTMCGKVMKRVRDLEPHFRKHHLKEPVKCEGV